MILISIQMTFRPKSSEHGANFREETPMSSPLKARFLMRRWKGSLNPLSRARGRSLTPPRLCLPIGFHEEEDSHLFLAYALRVVQAFGLGYYSVGVRDKE